MKFDSKLTFEDHVRGIVSVSLRELVFWEWWNVYLWTPLCYFVAILHLFFQSLSIVLRYGCQLLNVTFRFSSARCIRLPGFTMIGVSCRCVIDVVWLGLVCCTRLIRTLVSVCSGSFHLLLLEFDILELRPQLIHWSLKYQGVERHNLLGLSCRLRFDCGMTFPTLCLTPELWMGSRVQSTIGCFPELCFIQFSVEQVLVGLQKQFINNLVFPLKPVLQVLIIIIIMANRFK